MLRLQSETKRIRSGLYKVGGVESFNRRHPEHTVYVARGEVLNECTNFGMNRIRGVYESKWFVYLVGEYEWVHADNSGRSTSPIGTIRNGPFERKRKAVRASKHLLNGSESK